MLRGAQVASPEAFLFLDFSVSSLGLSYFNVHSVILGACENADSDSLGLGFCISDTLPQ